MSVRQDIKVLNTAYLFYMREVGKEDANEAACRFGVDKSTIEALVSATVDKIHEIADPSIMQIKLRAPSNLRDALNGNHSAAALAAVTMIGERK